MKEIQKQFEQWVKLQPKYQNERDILLVRNGIQNADFSPCYVYDVIQASWIAWQGSRDFIIADVGSLRSASYESDGVVYRGDVENMLDNLGVNLK